MSIFGKKKQPPAAASAPPEPVAVKSAPYQDKKKILIGLFLVVTAFICVVVIVFAMTRIHLSKDSRISDLQEKINILNDQRVEMETEVKDLRSTVDASPSLDRVVKAAKEAYGAEESGRKEGILWVDRHQRNLVVTLGLLNGVKPGARLKVYDKGEEFGSVTVSQAFDVISYVDSSKMIPDYSKDYYRVVAE